MGWCGGWGGVGGGEGMGILCHVAGTRSKKKKVPMHRYIQCFVNCSTKVMLVRFLENPSNMKHI